MAVDAQGSSADAAADVVAHEPSVVVEACVDADGVVELRDDGQVLHWGVAARVRTDYALRREGVDALCQALE